VFRSPRAGEYTGHSSSNKNSTWKFQMPVRESSLPEKRSAISLKAALMTAIIVVFGILHVVGAMWLHDAASPRPIDTSEVMMNRD
jgi:hypothetical protein